MEQPIEIWKSAVGYEGFYEVSNLGNVKSISNPTRYRPNQKPRVMTKFLNKFGYLKSSLCVQGITKCVQNHRLVAIAFIPNPDNKPCVNHKNGIKTDNRVENLEWATYSENEHHSYRILNKDIKGNRKTFKNGVNLKAKPILCVTTNQRFDSIKAACISLNVERSNVLKQIKGEIKQTGGYTFRFQA